MVVLFVLVQLRDKRSAQMIMPKRMIMNGIFLSMKSKKTVSAMTDFFKLSIFFALCLFMVGCSTCEDCDLNGNTETLCETEFDSPEQYQDAIADQEAQGAICSSTGGF